MREVGAGRACRLAGRETPVAGGAADRRRAPDFAQEWGWRPLADLLGRLARWRAWAQVETAIARLPPYAALFVFVVPSALLLPLKFLALFLVARDSSCWRRSSSPAKVVATALVARLFMLTQPALMQIGWFAWAYDTVMPWKEALVEHVRASRVWRVSQSGRSGPNAPLSRRRAPGAPDGCRSNMRRRIPNSAPKSAASRGNSRHAGQRPSAG